MSKTCKKLLASALAATMLISTFVSSLVVSAADVGTLTIGTTEITQSDLEQTAEVTLTYSYTPAVAAPHNLITFTSDFALTNVEVVEVNDKLVSEYGKDVQGDIVKDPCPISIDQDGTNYAEKKLILEALVKEDITISEVVLKASFTVPANAEANTYAISATSDYADFDEAPEDTVAITAGSIVVKAAHVCEAGTPVSNENGTHDIPCVGCDKLVADDEQCTYGDDGACTVCGYKEPVVEPELGELTATSASFVYKNSMELPIQYQGVSYSGDASAVEEFGIIAIREDKYDGVTPLTPQTPNAMSMTWDTVQSSPNLYIYGFAFKFITKEYIVVSYVKVGENYIYGEKYQESYADLCVNRIARGDTSSNGYKYAKHYLDTYYTLFDVKLYDGAENLPAADTSKKYVGNYTKTQHDFPVATGELTTSVSREDGTLLFNNMEFGYGVYFNYSGEAEVLKSGVLILREDKYTQGTAITKETPGVMFDEADGLMDNTYTIYGFSLANIAKDYIFVPYVETTEGTVYGEYRALAFADVILARLNASGHAKSKAIFDAYYMMASSSNITPSQLITAVDK